MIVVKDSVLIDFTGKQDLVREDIVITLISQATYGKLPVTVTIEYQGTLYITHRDNLKEE